MMLDLLLKIKLVLTVLKRHIFSFQTVQKEEENENKIEAPPKAKSFWSSDLLFPSEL